MRGLAFGILLATSVWAAPTREGTQVVLSQSEVADLKQWVENAKHDLGLLQDDIRRSTLDKRRNAIVREFEGIVNRSGAKENELLMRYILNRALEIDEVVGNNPAPSELQALVGFLDGTIELAKSFYTDDTKYLDAIGRGDTPQFQTPMPVFGYQYSEMIMGFSRTFLSPALEYQVSYKALGWLAHDLNSPRNLLRIQFADTITRIARIQGKFPATPQGDDAAILQSIREFKWEYRERVIKNLVAINAEIRDALARAEAKRAAEEKDRMEAERLSRMRESDRKIELARIESERKIYEELSAEDREIIAGKSPFPPPNSHPLAKEFDEFDRLSGSEDAVARNGHVELFFAGHKKELSLWEIAELLDQLKDPRQSAGDMEDEAVAERIIRATIQTRLTPTSLPPKGLGEMLGHVEASVGNGLVREYALPKRVHFMTEKQILATYALLRDPRNSAGDLEDEAVALKIAQTLVPLLSTNQGAVINSGKTLDERIDIFIHIIPGNIVAEDRNLLIRTYFRKNKDVLNSDQGSKLISQLRDPSHSAGDLEDEVIASEIRDYFLKKLNGN